MESSKRNAKGMGSFKENPDGTVTHRKHVGYKWNGKRKILTVTAQTKTACIRLMKEKEDAWKKEKESVTVSPKKTVAELCELHLEYQVKAGELKAKSIDRRECTIKQLEKTGFGSLQLQGLQVSEVDNYISMLISQQVYSLSSITKILDVLNAAFKWAVVRGELKQNPVEPIKDTIKKRIQKLNSRSANETDVDVLSPEEQIKFEETAKELWDSGKPKFPSGVYGLLLLHTGMRVGEALALRWSDIDFANRTININKSRSMAKNRNGKEGEAAYVMVEGTTKNEKARIIEMSDAALEDIRAIYHTRKKVSPNDYVIITRTGKPHTTTSMEHRMATIYQHAGLTHLKGGVHILRRTFATEMYAKGARSKEIAAYIGDLESTTERYYIAVRKKRIVDGKAEHIVTLPTV